MKMQGKNKEKGLGEYFSKISKDLQIQPVQESNRMAKAMTDLLYQEIEESKVQMPSKLGVKKLKIQIKKQKQQSPINAEEQLKRVQSQKKSALTKMRQLQQEEFALRRINKATLPKKIIQLRSVLTEEDKGRLKILVKQSRKYEQSIKRKDERIEEMLRERSIEERLSEEKLHQERRKLKRAEVLQNLKSMELKSAERERQLQKSEHLVKEIKKKKYLHNIISEKQAEQREEKAHDYEQRINQIKQKMKFDIEEIQEHQKNYQYKLNEYRDKMSSRVSIAHSRSKSYGQNQFRSLMLNRLEQERIEEYNKLNRGHDMKEKVCKYLEQINEKHKPKVSKNSKFSLPKQKSVSTHALSSKQQRLQGLDYLEKAKKLKDLQKQRQRRKTLEAPKIKPEPAYTDYSKNIKVKPYETVETEFNTLVKKGRSVQDYDQAIKAVLLAQRIQARSKKSKDQILVNSVQHKLQILQAFEGR